jgi:SAM domain (Sterile alpha motif)
MIGAGISDLRATLEELGLQEYESLLFDHGFDTWNSLASTNETEMENLGIKLGHRRKIQRENARRLGHLANEPLTSPPASVKHQQRKHTRRPLRDPEFSSKSDDGYVAYVRFLCQDPKISNLSLVETAKLVGERWSTLPSDIKDAWNVGATEKKASGNSELTQYRQSGVCQDYGIRFTSWTSREAEYDNNILPMAHGRLSQSSIPRSTGINAPALGKGTNCFECIPQYPGELVESSPSGSVS